MTVTDMPPPYSPREGNSSLLPPGSGAPQSHSSNSSIADPGIATPEEEELEPVDLVAGRAPFETASPISTNGTEEILTHSVTLAPNLMVEDVPYPEPADAWLARNVSSHDWQQFLMSVLPYHSQHANAQTAERKRRVEQEHDNEEREILSPRQRTVEGQAENVRALREAQLGNLRGQKPEEALSSTYSPSQQDWVETKVAEWNEGFFGPRRLKIIAHYHDEETAQLRRDIEQTVDEELPPYPARPISQNNAHYNGAPGPAYEQSEPPRDPRAERERIRQNLNEMDALDLTALKSALSEFFLSGRENRVAALEQLSSDVRKQRRHKTRALEDEIRDTHGNLYQEMRDVKRRLKEEKKALKHEDLSKAQYKQEKRMLKEEKHIWKAQRKQSKQVRKENKGAHKDACKSQMDFTGRRAHREHAPHAGGARGFGSWSARGAPQDHTRAGPRPMQQQGGQVSGVVSMENGA